MVGRMTNFKTKLVVESHVIFSQISIWLVMHHRLLDFSKRERETERERQRETEGDRERQRETETERDRERQRETERDRERQRDRDRQRQSYRKSL